MKNLIVMLFLSASLLFADDYKKVKIDIQSRQDIARLISLGMEFDHFEFEDGRSLEVFISGSDFEILKSSGFGYEILIDDWIKFFDDRNSKIGYDELELQRSLSQQNFGVKSFDFGSMGGYYTLDEVYQKLDEMFSAYPDLITQKASIGATHESRDIYFVKISDNPNSSEDEPQVLYTALHHAREPESMMQLIYFMFYLLENYNVNPEVKFLVDSRELYFIPVVNPDGYFYNQSTNPNGGGMWRKNRSQNMDGSRGVDLNRNYGPMEYWNSSNGGSSTQGGSDTYRGTAPFSEPETSAIRDFLSGLNIRNCLNYHTYGSYLIFPYGAINSETKDSLIFRDFSSSMTKYNGYTTGTDMQTVNYNTRGNSDDFMYDGDTNLVGSIIAMTPEVGKSTDGFWPASNRIIPLAEENIFPNLYFAWAAGGLVEYSAISQTNEYALPGSEIFLNVRIRNVGLGNAENIRLLGTSSEDGIVVETPNLQPLSLSSREESNLDNAIKIKIPNDAQIGKRYLVELQIYSGEILMSSDQFDFVVGMPDYLFTDNAADLNNWISYSTKSSSKWDLSESDFFDEPTAFTDSKTGNYASNVTATLTLIEEIDLNGTQNPYLSFYTKFAIEKKYDYGQVQASSDSGKTWKPVEGKLTSNSSGISPQPFNQPVYHGFLRDWVKEEISLEEFIGKKILVRFLLVSDAYIEFDGWYVDDLAIYFYPSPTDVDNSYQTKIDYNLYQNYPNPFNPETHVRFSIAEDGLVSLRLFNLLGEEIAVIVNRFYKAGSYSISINAVQYLLSSGVYILQMQTNNFSGSKKMLYLR